MVVKVDWAVIENDYVTDKTSTAASLSLKYGVNAKTIQGHVTKDSWMSKRGEYQSNLGKKLLAQTEKSHAQAALEWNQVDIGVIRNARSLIVRGLNAIQLNSASKEMSAQQVNTLSILVKSYSLLHKMGRLSHNLTTENVGTQDPDDESFTPEQLEAINKFLDESNG